MLNALWKNVVFGPGYAWARTFIALGSLLTLLVNPAEVLFAPMSSLGGDYAARGEACDLHGYALFCAMDPALGRLVAIAVLVLVCSGWRPRVTGMLHWWVSSSVFLVATANDGGDQVAAVITLLLVPLTLLDDRRSHWELPSLDPSPPIRQKCLRVVASLVLLMCHVQIAIIYFHAAVGKMAVEDWQNGTALYYWFQHGHVAMPAILWDALGQQVLSSPTLLPLVTWSVVVFECAIAFMLFAGPRVRRVFFVPAVAFHIGILLLHGITSFSIIMIGTLCLYLMPVRSSVTGREPRWSV